MKVDIEGRTLELVEGDIAQQKVDAIVNAANSRLAGGGGVDGAIHRAGGPTIMQETDERYPDGCPTGSAVISRAGELPAKYVIHAVGPVWNGGGYQEEEKLAGAFQRCLEIASEQDCDSIAFPAISCGIYGYPIDQASQIALCTSIQFLRQNDKPATVRFVLFGSAMADQFRASLKQLMDDES